jgi:hypothetical protein
VVAYRIMLRIGKLRLNWTTRTVEHASHSSIEDTQRPAGCGHAGSARRLSCAANARTSALRHNQKRVSADTLSSNCLLTGLGHVISPC